MFEGLAWPIVLQDERGRVVFANRAFCRSFDIGRDRVLGAFGTEYVHEPDRAAYVEFVRACREGSMRPLFVRAHLRSGDLRPLVVLPCPILDESRSLGTILIVLDAEPISDALAESERRSVELLRSILHELSKEARSLATPPASREGFEQARGHVPALAELTDREWEVAVRIGEGDRTAQVASDLGISAHTVRNHLKAIFRKTGVASQPGLVTRLRQWRADAVALANPGKEHR